MKGIDPIWLTVITTVVAIDNWIGSGKVDLHHVFPDGWIPSAGLDSWAVSSGL